VTRTVVFDSSCDPFGANPAGHQAFAMRPDGSGLRQLTAAPGFAEEASGAVAADHVGQVATSGMFAPRGRAR
jgi:hypothetical protein